ncbi:MAG: hypothetical protein HC858_13080 [Brachymonas sp.]|nr:hypothetical protein [Brachymonas sp.]
MPMQNVFWVRVQPPLPSDIKIAGVYFEFMNAPSFSKRFSESLSAAGYKMTDRGTAKYQIVIEGGFGTQGKVESRGDLGKALEAGLSSPEAASKDAGATAVALGNLGFTTVFTERMVSAGLMNQLVAGQGFLNSLADATGFRGWFNEKVAGDRRGVCMFNCELWTYSNQRINLRFKEPSDWKHEGLPYNIGVGIHSPTNYMQELTNLALIELQRYFGLVDVEQPARFQAVMTRQEIIDSQKNQRLAREP